MQKRNNLIALAALWLLPSAHALSPEAMSILSKKNRRLEAPPKALRASEASVDLRYASGRSRLAATPTPEPSMELESVPVTNPTDYGSLGSSGFSFDGGGRDKSERVFGMGFMSAGAYGVFGAEVDFALLQEWTFGFGVGTGMDFASWGVHSRYVMRKAALSPFVELGYANWRLGKVSDRTSEALPSYLARRFFEPKEGGGVTSSTAHILYPGIGVSYMFPSGMTLVGQAQYMVQLRDFSGGLTGSAGLYYYF